MPLSPIDPPFIVNGSGLAVRAVVSSAEPVSLAPLFGEAGELRWFGNGELLWSDAFDRASWARLEALSKLTRDGQTRATDRVHVDGSGKCPVLTVQGRIYQGLRLGAEPLELNSVRDVRLTFPCGAEVCSAWVTKRSWTQAVNAGQLG